MTDTPTNSSELSAQHLDALIIGGGIAGVWLLNLLNRRGYRVILLEAQALGCAQTLASQGMIHGGLKYALSGSLNPASEAIAQMPQRWRQCLAGNDEVDLQGLVPLSDRYYMFAAASTLGKLTTFFASKTLRGRIRKLRQAEFPGALSNLNGSVYELNDFVLDTRQLLRRLLEPVNHLAFRTHVDAAAISRKPDGWQLRLDKQPALDKQSAMNEQLLQADKLIFCAGAGIGPLLGELDIDEPRMQLRPLQQVVVRHRNLQPLYAHCLTGIHRAEPRLTITSHPDTLNADGSWLWYLGGQLATNGAGMEADALIAHARNELSICVPWINWSEAQFSTLNVDRAEPEQRRGHRPDEAFAQLIDDCIVCWPTKLSLAPDLGDRVTNLLAPPAAPKSSSRPPLHIQLPQIEIAEPGWLST